MVLAGSCIATLLLNCRFQVVRKRLVMARFLLHTQFRSFAGMFLAASSVHAMTSARIGATCIRLIPESTASRRQKGLSEVAVVFQKVKRVDQKCASQFNIVIYSHESFESFDLSSGNTVKEGETKKNLHSAVEMIGFYEFFASRRAVRSWNYSAHWKKSLSVALSLHWALRTNSFPNESFGSHDIIVKWSRLACLSLLQDQTAQCSVVVMDIDTNQIPERAKLY